jgi:hypothetical protein
MERKKGIYDLSFFTTKEKHETIVSAVNWKQIQEKLTTNYKEFINVKDIEHTTEPFILVITSATLPASKKEKEEYYYTKRK